MMLVTCAALSLIVFCNGLQADLSVSFDSSADVTVDEEDSGQVQLLITGSPSAGITPSFPIILDLGIQTISSRPIINAVVGEDFTTPSNTTSFTLSIDNNTQGGIEANVTLGILDDQTIEGDHGFVVTIMTSPNYSLGASTSRAVIIVDTTDVSNLQVDFNNDDENDDSAETGTSIEVLLREGKWLQACAIISSSGRDIDVNLQITVPFVLEFKDYYGYATQEDIAAFEEPQEFLFMKPISSGDIDCINISAILDNILEGDETFCVLFNSSGSIPFGVTDTERLLNVLIADADVDTKIGLSSSEIIHSEAELYLNVCLSLNETMVNSVATPFFIRLVLDTVGDNRQGNGHNFKGEKFPDISSLTLPEGCPFSPFNDPPFPAGQRKIPRRVKKFFRPSFRVMGTFPPGDIVACIPLLVIGDENFEGEEMFSISIYETGPDFSLPLASGREMGNITLRDPEDAVISFTNATFVTREGENVTLCIRLQSFGNILFPVNFTLEDNEDFDVIGSDRGFPIGSVSGDFFCYEVIFIDDNILEGDESLIISLTSDAATTTNLTVIVQDHTDLNETRVEFVPINLTQGAVFRISEPPGGSVQTTEVPICVSVIAEPDDGRAVPIMVEATPAAVGISPAIFGTDWKLNRTSIVIEPESTMECFQVIILKDELFELVESFQLSLSVSPSVAVMGIDVFSLAIDDQTAGFELSVAGDLSLTLTEGENQRFNVCMEVTNLPADGLSFDPMAVFSVDANTAVFGADYRLLRIPVRVQSTAMNGSIFCTSLDINELILNDEIVENEETFTISILPYVSSSANVLSPSPAVPIALGSPDTINITILDNDNVQVGFQQMEYTVNETSVSEGFSVCIEHKESLEKEINLQIFQESSPGIKRGAFDIIADVVIGSGARSNNTIVNMISCFNFSATEDEIKERTEVIFLTLNTSDPSVCVGRDFTLVYVQPNGEVIVRLSSGNQTVSEDAGSVKVCVELDHSPLVPVSITLSTESGTALGGEDFISIEKNLTFAVGLGTVQCINIPIINDECFEDINESFSVSLSSSVNCIIVEESAQAIQVIITDDDAASVSLVQEEISVTEGDSNISICLEVQGLGNGVLKIPVTVQLGSTALNSFTNITEDFSIDSLEVIFPANLTSNGNTQCITVFVEDDNILEGDNQQFLIQTESISPANANLVPGDKTVITIADNDEDDATVAFQVTSYQVEEKDKSVEVCVSLFGIPDGGREVDIQLKVIFSPSSTMGSKPAILGEDWTLPNATIIIDTQETDACVMIPIVNDTLFEATEALQATITTTSPPINIDHNNATTTIFITDSSGGVELVAMGQQLLSFSEDETGCFNVCIQVTTLPNDGLGCDIVATFLTQGETAIAGEDFRQQSVNVTVKNTAEIGSAFCTEMRIDDIVLDDAVVENEQAFRIELQSTSPTVSIGPTKSFNITIRDNDDVQVSFLQQQYTVIESMGSSKICVEHKGRIQRTLTLQVYQESSTDIARGDLGRSFVTELIVGRSATYNNTIMDSVSCFNYSHSEDDVKEGLEMVYLTLNTSDSGVCLGRDLAFVNVPPNGEVIVRLSSGNQTVSEDAGSVKVCVELDHSPLVPVSITLSTESGTALGGEDFISIEKNLTFAVGLGIVQCINIPIINDECFEDINESFSVSLSSSVNCVIVEESAQAIQIIITDDDSVSVFLVREEIFVTEGDSNISVCLEVQGLGNGVLKIPVTVQLGGTALNSFTNITEDFSIDSLEVIFPANSPNGNTRCITVSVEDDNILEGDNQQFLIQTESISPANANLVPGDKTVITIADNDEDDATVAFQITSYQVREEDESVEVCVLLLGVPDGGREVNIKIKVIFSPSPIMEAKPATLGEDWSLPNATIIIDTQETDACVVIPIVNDTLFEATEALQATITTTSPPINIDHNNATTTIFITDSSGGVELVATGQQLLSFSEDETGCFNVCIQVTTLPNDGLGCDIVATFLTQGETAIASEDFRQQSINVTVKNTAEIGSVFCTEMRTDNIIVDDAIVENEQAFRIELQSTSPTVSIGPTKSFNITIRDNDDVQVSFLQQQYTVIESMGSSKICVEHKGRIQRTLTLQVYQESSIDITRGDLGRSFVTELMVGRSATYNNTIMDSVSCFNYSHSEDDVKEGLEMVYLTLNTSDSGVCLGRDLAFVNVPPNGEVIVRLSSGNQTVSEDAGSVKVCVELDHSPLVPVSITLSTESGTALSGEDFISIEKNLTCAGIIQCIDIPIINDECFEDVNESFSVSLSSRMDCVIVEQSAQAIQVIISDDDAALVSLVQEKISVTEGDSNISVCLKVQGLGNGVLKIPVAVRLGSTALNSFTNITGDFSIDSLEVIFPPNSSNGNTRCITVSVEDDDILEGDNQQFLIQTESISPANANLVPGDKTVITIADNDEDDATVAFQVTSYRVREEDKSAEVCVLLFGVPNGGREVDIQAEVIFSPSMQAKPATLEEDWILPNATIIIDTQETDACVVIPIVNDTLFEATEALQATITTTSPPINIDHNNATITIFITDSSGGVELVAMGQQLLSFSEDETGCFNVCIQVTTLPNDGLGCDIVTTFLTQGETAIAGEDFRQQSVNVTVKNTAEIGSVFCTEMRIDDIVLDDAIVENEQAFRIELQSTSPTVSIGPTTSFNITIRDNDDVQVSFLQQQYTVIESMGSSKICVEHKGRIQRTLTLQVYQESSIDITRGDLGRSFVTELMVGRSATYNNTIMDSVSCFNYSHSEDDVKEGLEMVYLTLNTSDSGVCLGRDLAFVNVPPNGEVIVRLSSGNQTVSEDAGSVKVCVELDHSPLVPVSITLSTESGTALGGEDFISIEKNLTFAVGLGIVQCIDIPILNDECLEDRNESFFVSLSSSNNCVIIEKSTQTSQVTIADNDGITVSLTAPNYSVNESSRFLQVCAHITVGMVKREIEMLLRSEPGSAQGSNDYLSTFAPLNFASGDRTGSTSCSNIIIQNDITVEDDEFFNVRISTTDSAITIHPHVSAQVVITDDDSAIVTMDEHFYQVSEGDDALTVCALLSSNLERSVSVSIISLCDEACSPGDFREVNEVVRFGPNGRPGLRQCVRVTLNDEEVVEDDEIFRVTLSPLSGFPVAIAFPHTVPIVLLDNDLLTISFEESVYTVPETEGSVTVCIVTGNVLERDISISVISATLRDTEGQLLNNSASSGVDFIPLSTEITFSSGSMLGSRECVAVTIINNNEVEFDEMFELQLDFNPAQVPVEAGERNKAVVVIVVERVIFTVFPRSLFIIEGRSDDVCVAVEQGRIEATQSIEITVTTQDMSAAGNGRDYRNFTTPLIFNENTAHSCVSVITVQDLLYEVDETFSISLMVQDPIAVISISTSSVTILDNDQVTFSLLVPESICEGSEGSICIQLGTELEREALAEVMIFDSQKSTQTNVGFIFNSASATEQCTTLEVEEDDIPESCSTFEVMLLSPSQRVNITPGNGNATIFNYDNDAIIVNYINDTPEMDGQDMRVNLETAGCFETLTCSLQRGRQVNCSTAVNQDLIIQDAITSNGPGRISLIPQPLCGQQVAAHSRVFRRDSILCSSHLINRGITVFDNGTVKVEFEPTGPSAEEQIPASSFICRVDNEPFVSCDSPYYFDATTKGLQSGQHRFIARPPSDSRCRRRIGLNRSFSIP